MTAFPLSPTSYRLGPVASHVPPGRLDNAARAEALNTNLPFLDAKIGTRAVSRMAPGEDTSDLAAAAVRALEAKLGGRAALEGSGGLGCLVLVTQTPDGRGLPHSSAILHEKLGLSHSCACFDISLGCSGFVYGEAVLRGTLAAMGQRRGLLVTADPYSKIVDENDRNTVLLFGDGAAAALVVHQDEPEGARGWRTVAARHGSEGSGSAHLAVRESGLLHMSGRDVFTFAARRMPSEIAAVLDAAGWAAGEIDQWWLHQGSKYIVESLAKRIGAPMSRVPLALDGVGNTISSTIPMLLEDAPEDARRAVMAGFGVGFSYACAALERDAA